jgi:amidase
MSVLASPDPRDAPAWRLQLPPPRHKTLRDYRIAAWLDDPAAPVDRAVLRQLEATLEALEKEGALVDRNARPPFTLADMYEVAYDLIVGVSCAALSDGEFDAFSKAAAQFPREDKGQIASFLRANTQSKRDWGRTNERRWQMRAGWGAFFEQFDVLLCPPAQTTAFVHDQGANPAARTVLVNGVPRVGTEAVVWAGFVGAAGLPATVAPVGLSDDGLPVGVQIVGPYLEDYTTIDFARLIADIIGGYNPPPGSA